MAEDLPKLPLPEGHLWQPDRFLASGGGGSAWCWKQVDGNGNIVRRIVVKKIEDDPKSIVIQKGRGKGELGEAFMMQQLRVKGPVANIHSVPILQKPAGHTMKAVWSIYMPFYAYGNLANLIEPDPFKHKWIYPLPEPFIWWMFLRLAKVAVAMDTQLRTPKRTDVLVHLDIKPENIFMGTPGSEGNDADFPMYPPGVLGDFGCARLTYKGDPGAGDLTNRGTNVWFPPEIDAYRPGHVEKSMNQRPAHSYTNIWQIGLVILGILEGQGYVGRKPIWDQSGTHNPVRKNPEYEGARWKKLVEENKFNGWSQDLLGLVYQCTEFWPEDRPSPQYLVKRIEEMMPAHEDVMRRWGTTEWFTQQEKEAAGSKGEVEAEGGAAEITSPGGTKRKRNTKDDTEAQKQRTARNEEISKRRKKLVGVQLSEGRKKHEGPPDHVSPDDDRFILAEELKIFYPSIDPLFDVEDYFSVLHSTAEDHDEIHDATAGLDLSIFEDSSEESGAGESEGLPPGGEGPKDKKGGKFASFMNACCSPVFKFTAGKDK